MFSSKAIFILRLLNCTNCTTIAESRVVTGFKGGTDDLFNCTRTVPNYTKAMGLALLAGEY